MDKCQNYRFKSFLMVQNVIKSHECKNWYIEFAQAFQWPTNVEKLCIKYDSYRMYYVYSVYMHTSYTMQHTLAACIITSAKEVVKLHIMYRAVYVCVREW